MEIKVSLIVPIYKVEQYLRECLTSLVSQTLSEIEIICVNDNTPDNSMVICEEFAQKDPRVKIIDKKNNEGLGLTRNVGIEAAKGEFIAFVDSDDYVALDMYEKLYNEAKQNRLDVCYCGYATDYYGKIEFKNGSAKHRNQYLGKDRTRQFLLEMIGPEPEYKSEVKYMISAWDCIYSSSIIKEYNVRFMCERAILSEDTLFNIDFLVCACNVGFIPDQLYRYRYTPSSLSRTFNHNKAKTFVALLEELQKKLASNFREEEYKEHYLRYVFYIFRLLIKYEAVINIDGKRKESIEKWCDHSLLHQFINEYPYQKMDVKRRLFIFFLKHKWIYALIGMSVLENKLKKNI